MDQLEVIFQMFKIRDENYDTSTQNIYSYVKPLIEGINKFFNSNDFVGVKPGISEVTWDEVILVKGSTESALMFVGTVAVPVGTEVVLESGEKVIVTKETFDYFKKICKAVIPQDRYNATSDEIFDYLVKQKQEGEALIKAKNEQVQNATLQKSVLKDFDFSQLTPEQKSRFVFTDDMIRSKN